MRVASTATARCVAVAQVHELSSPAQSSGHVVLLSEDLESAWDSFVESHGEATLFHTTAWRKAVAEAFGHEPVYLVALCGDRVVGILPMFVVWSRIAGRMLVSVPYGVGGGAVADDDEVVAALFQRAKDIGAARECWTLELRSERARIPSLPTVARYVVFRRALPTAPSDVLGWLPRKARAAARNARDKFGLTVEFGDEGLTEAWRLYSISMRRLASLNYPLRFFEKLLEHTPGRHWVSLVRREGRVVAGLVTFLFKDRVMPYFVGTTADARTYHAANFIYLTAMERGVERGYREFDFGRTRRENTGSYNFKRYHGFEPHPLGYQRCTLREHRAVDLYPSNPRLQLARRLWTHLPLAITRVVGAGLAKHIPG
ncbi:MAG: FemAB family XrtA/PEP-CTERM system-associated protein [Phycisphaerae bacterium]